jgi:hypothetical protein
VNPFAIASVYAQAEEVNRSLEWLERAHDERPPELVYLKVRPEFDSLRSDPRFQELVQAMHYPDYRE